MRFSQSVIYELPEFYVLPLEDLTSLDDLSEDTPVLTLGFFTLTTLRRGANKVAFKIKAKLRSTNTGTFLWVSPTSVKKDLSEPPKVLLKLPELVVYDFPGLATLLVSASVSDSVKYVLDNQ